MPHPSLAFQAAPNPLIPARQLPELDARLATVL
jgi:hypothetical protein